VHWQLTLTASFVPPLPPLESRGPPALQLTEISSDGASTPTGLSLAPPRTPYASSTPDGEAHLPPITPNPFPGMPEGEEQYAKAEGLVVWEGAVAEIDKTQGGRMEFRRDTGWEVVWRGEVPIGELFIRDYHN